MEIAINRVNNHDVESNAATDSNPGSVSTIESAPSVRFAIVAKTISQVVASCGLEVPGIKSPPRSGDVDRTVRRVNMEALLPFA